MKVCLLLPFTVLIFIRLITKTILFCKEIFVNFHQTKNTKRLFFTILSLKFTYPFPVVVVVTRSSSSHRLLVVVREAQVRGAVTWMLIFPACDGPRAMLGGLYHECLMKSSVAYQYQANGRRTYLVGQTPLAYV